ncbi:MAG: hypothetical protein E3J76_03615 [Candidatus Aminicenantes bacterium]|nr:MAG: hypothetical protein E3J76_03615 [Candidatus Aminicenantes bacterium]
MKPITIIREGDFRFGEYEPGNGTNYKAIMTRWLSGQDLKVLGKVTFGWLVVNCNTGLAHLFQEKGLLTDDYIQEKLGGLDGDYPYFGDLIRRLIGREN